MPDSSQFSVFLPSFCLPGVIQRATVSGVNACLQNDFRNSNRLMEKIQKYRSKPYAHVGIGVPNTSVKRDAPETPCPLA